MHLIFFKQIIMAVIGNIRKHSTFLVIVIGVALAAFILGDFAKGNGGSRNILVGDIEGEEVTIMDFNSETEKNIDLTMQQQQKDRLSYDEIFSVKEQTWNDIVRKVIMNNEYDELGLTVTSDELYDLVQGPNPHELIKQYFADPATKQYDRNLVINYLSNLDNMPENSKQQWVRFEKYIKEDHLNKKFKTLVAKGYYVPKELAAMMYSDKNDKADIDYVAAKYVDIKDSIFTPTEDNYADYYNNNKEKYKEKAGRDIEYVVFKIIPSANDINDAKKEMNEIAYDLKTTIDVPRFVKVNSDKPYDSSWMTQGKLPVQIDSLMFNSTIGTVSEPYMLNGSYNVARLMNIGNRPDSMKASHILIAYQGAYNAQEGVTRTKDDARLLTDSILNVLKKSSKKLTALAEEFSNDPSVEQNDGDLGWFEDGQMVPAFNKAVYDTKVGKFTSVETPFGFHVIKVTGKKDLVKKVKVAMIEREIFASDATYQEVFAKASKLATECKTKEQFDNYVSDNRLNKRSMPTIRKMSNYIAGLTNPRTIIKWAYNENTSVGNVSTVFDLDDMFVVAVLTKKIEAGYPSLDDVKDKIHLNVVNKLKGEYFVEKMSKYNGNLNSIKENMDVMEKHVSPLFFSSRNLPGFAIENTVIGEVFGSENGITTKPIIGNSAVFVVKVNSITKSAETTNYSPIINEVKADFTKRVDQDYPYNALKESIEIIDNRIDFY